MRFSRKKGLASPKSRGVRSNNLIKEGARARPVFFVLLLCSFTKTKSHGTIPDAKIGMAPHEKKSQDNSEEWHTLSTGVVQRSGPSTLRIWLHASCWSATPNILAHLFKSSMVTPHLERDGKYSVLGKTSRGKRSITASDHLLYTSHPSDRSAPKSEFTTSWCVLLLFFMLSTSNALPRELVPLRG